MHFSILLFHGVCMHFEGSGGSDHLDFVLLEKEKSSSKTNKRLLSLQEYNNVKFTTVLNPVMVKKCMSTWTCITSTTSNARNLSFSSKKENFITSNKIFYLVQTGYVYYNTGVNLYPLLKMHCSILLFHGVFMHFGGATLFFMNRESSSILAKKNKRLLSLQENNSVKFRENKSSVGNSLISTRTCVASITNVRNFFPLPKQRIRIMLSLLPI